MDFSTASLKAMLELQKATEKYGKFNSSHEGYAVILEKMDELWGLIKSNASQELLEKKAKQVAAMALRFLVDIC